MLLKPTKEQLEEIETKSHGRNNGLRYWINKKRARISVKLLHRYLIDLTEEQEEYLQAKRLIERMRQ